MSQILIQESKYEKYARALENTKYEQCFGSLSDGNRRCAVGVILSECFGWDGTKNKYGGVNDPLVYNALQDEIRGDIITKIWVQNDGWKNTRHSFKEIAQWLREQK